MASSSASLAGCSASDLLRSSTSGFTGVPLRTLGRTGLVLKRRDLTVSAKMRKVKKHEYPWSDNPDPNVKGGMLRHLSSFKPLKEKPKPITLDFERPLVDLQKKINEVRKMANDTGLDFSDQILLLENKYQQALKDLYTHLTPIQRVNIARHPNRPTFLDHVFNITEKFVELHGDRAGYDDPAIVTGIGTIDGKSYMFIGHQKGRNTKENIKRNFAMPTPHGYRKALRLMEYADHHGFPIITFIDTPGAYADLKSEELGQGEAIAHNLRSMFGLKVPIVSIVIGEGGSGGALAIGCGNKLLMLENAVFYVASPEACAAILWKSSKAAPKAAEKLKITAPELAKLQICDGIIPEPLGGAHADPEWTSQQIKKAITEAMDELTKMNTEDLLKDRMHKFRKLGGFSDGGPGDPKKKINMKKKDVPVVKKISDAKLEVEVGKLKQKIVGGKESSSEPPKLDLVGKLKQKIVEGKGSSSEPPKLDLDEMIKKLEKEVDQEISEAVKAMGLTDKVSKLREEVSKASSDNQTIDPLLKDKIEKLEAEFYQGLSAAPNSGKLQKKRDMLKDLYEAKRLSDRNKEAATLKQELKKKPGRDVPEIEELNKDVKKEIDIVVNSSPDIKNKIEQLRLEVAKAGETPDTEAQNRISALKQQVKQSLAEAVDLSSLKKKYENLVSKASSESETSEEFDGSLKKEDPAGDGLTDDELREKVSADSTFS